MNPVAGLWNVLVNLPRWIRLKRTDGCSRFVWCTMLRLLFHLVSWSWELPAGQIKLSALQMHRGAQQPFHKNRALNPSTFTAIHHLRQTHSEPQQPSLSQQAQKITPVAIQGCIFPPCTLHRSLSLSVALRSVSSCLIEREKRGKID